jgi:hypothetical protein
MLDIPDGDSTISPTFFRREELMICQEEDATCRREKWVNQVVSLHSASLKVYLSVYQHYEEHIILRSAAKSSATISLCILKYILTHL